MAAVTDEAIDAALTASAAGARASPTDPIDDALVRAWRAGTLDDAAAEQLEARLAIDPEARALAFAYGEAGPPPALTSWAEAQVPGGGRRTWWAAAAAVLLLGIGGAWWMSRGGGPRYLADAPTGSIRTTMSDTAPATGIYGPASRLKIVLRPAAPVESAPPITVFADRGEAALPRVSSARIVAGEAGIVRVEVPMGDAFGQAFGARRLLIAVGPWSGEAPPRIAGPDETRQWIEVPVTYADR